MQLAFFRLAATLTRLPAPGRTQGMEYQGVSRGQFAGVGDNLIGVVNNWIARDIPRLMSDDPGAVLTCRVAGPPERRSMTL